jgi:hypothetical protein
VRNSKQLKQQTAELKEQLASRMADMAVQLLGNPTSRSGREWRWGQHGSLSVEIAGANVGRYFDHETVQGGGPIDLIMHARRCSFRDAVNWARAFVGGTAPATAYEPSQVKPAPDEAARARLASKIWREAVDPKDTPVETYLQSRGLILPTCDDLRFHPTCPRGANERLPAMVALMRDPATHAPRCIHRTYLRDDGRGKVEHGDKKLVLGPSAGAVVMLSPSEDVTTSLAIAEGIETSLSILVAGMGPVWAAGNAGNIRHFPVLPGIEGLTIFADNDAKSGTGLDSAQVCAQRWADAGRDATIRLPNGFKDWNEVLQSLGKAAA